MVFVMKELLLRNEEGNSNFMLELHFAFAFLKKKSIFRPLCSPFKNKSAKETFTKAYYFIISNKVCNAVDFS